MVYKYAFQGYDEKNMARGVGIALKGVSRKDAIEIANFIRGRKISKVVSDLTNVSEMKKAVPYRRFNHGIGHRKGGIGPGRFPQKAAAAILKIVNSVKSNAEDKNLNSELLQIKHVAVQKAPNAHHPGRHGGRLVKQCHVEIVVSEIIKTKKSSTKKVETKNEETKND